MDRLDRIHRCLYNSPLFCWDVVDGQEKNCPLDLWIIGDVISVPLYLYKGLGLTSLQYFIFTLIAIFGYIEWKKSYNNSKQAA